VSFPASRWDREKLPFSQPRSARIIKGDRYTRPALSVDKRALGPAFVRTLKSTPRWLMRRVLGRLSIAYPGMAGAFWRGSKKLCQGACPRSGELYVGLDRVCARNAGEYTDPFTLQYVAGHDNIKTTMRYAHPQEAVVHKLFARFASCAARGAHRVQEGGAKSGAAGNPFTGRTC